VRYSAVVQVAVVCQQFVDKLQECVTIRSPDVEQVLEFKELISNTYANMRQLILYLYIL
jgi:hypothetical protein